MGANAKMLKNGRSDHARGNSYNGCSCCNSKQCRRAAIKGVKGKENRAWKRDAEREAGER